MSITSQRLTWAIALATALGCLAWMLFGGDDDYAPPQGEATSPMSSASSAPRAAAVRLAASAPTNIEEAARLLELGVAGDLSVDLYTRSALDILLASLGPDATPADLERLDATLRRSMPGEAATQAMALVRRYDAYNRAANAEAATQKPPSSAEELKELLEKSMALRRQHFDAATARALFGAEEEQTRLDLAMNAIQADPRLSSQEKLAQTAALREKALRETPSLQTPIPPAIAEMDRQLAALRQQGGTPAQVEQLRARYLGEEAARSLAESDAQRAHWESRYQAYAQQKKAIVAAAPSDMAAQLDSALRQHFKEEELAAARAYDRNQTP
ncbi:MAG TPA: lipase secretion chaperone [Rhizobacter sp.]|nr:lipase secretion chaperone [Rhizobacter sp.]